jgi:hypothetical protein
MGFELTEWNAPVPTLWQDYQYQVQQALLCVEAGLGSRLMCSVPRRLCQHTGNQNTFDIRLAAFIFVCMSVMLRGVYASVC